MLNGLHQGEWPLQASYIYIYIYIYIYVVGNGKQKWKVYRKTSMVIPELFLYM